MKTILNKIGAISKPAIVGTALGLATIVVGLGVLTTFTGGKGGPKGFSGAALEQYSGQQGGAGVSARDLEARLALAEQVRRGDGGMDSVASLQAAAARDRDALAYGGSNGGRGAAQGVGSVAGAGHEGSLDGMYASGQGVDAIAAGESYGGAGAAGAYAQGAAEEQGVEAVGLGQGVMSAAANAGGSGNALRTSQTMSGSQVRSGGLGSGSTAAGGSLYSAGSSNERGSGAGVAVPQAGAAALNAGDVNAFRGGRAGAMGGFGVRASGDGSGGSGQAYSSGSLGDLASAHRYSSGGKGAVYGDTEKGAALAAAAFDGSQENQGITMSGEGTVQKQANQALQDYSANDPNAGKLNASIGKVNDLGNQISEEQALGKEYRKKIGWKMAGMAGTAIVAAIAVAALMKAFRSAQAVPLAGQYAGLGFLIGAIAVAAAAIVGFFLFLYAGGEGILDLVKKLDDMKYSGGSGGLKSLAWVLFGLSTALVGISFIVPQIKQALAGIKKTAGSVGDGFLKMIGWT
ncbi:MAG: hypothetical protein LBR90_01250 [Elusimicrobiota bacterium]|jgi:hypothetical protein|nr:hypothetical protein [Elusimicrobiota bacterium]